MVWSGNPNIATGTSPREQVTIPITFGTADLGWFAGLLHADRSGWIQQQMATYDPLTQIVVVLVQDAAPPRAYVIETDMSPAVAYARSQAVLN